MKVFEMVIWLFVHMYKSENFFRGRYYLEAIVSKEFTSIFRENLLCAWTEFRSISERYFRSDYVTSNQRNSGMKTAHEI